MKKMAWYKALRLWEWRRPGVHRKQSLWEAYCEQVASVMVLYVGLRAYRRKDYVTGERMRAIIRAGEAHE